MKLGKCARLVKHIISVVSCAGRAKCMAIRSKADAMKARLMVTALTVLSNKKSFSLDDDDGKTTSKEDSAAEDQVSEAVVLYNNKTADRVINVHGFFYDDVDGDKYPDLRHSMFEEEELAQLLDDPNSSVSAIDIVKNSKENGESFNLEKEIDEVADLFITKFHKKMRLQKLLSFKRYQQMLERSA